MACGLRPFSLSGYLERKWPRCALGWPTCAGEKRPWNPQEPSTFLNATQTYVRLDGKKPPPKMRWRLCMVVGADHGSILRSETTCNKTTKLMDGCKQIYQHPLRSYSKIDLFLLSSKSHHLSLKSWHGRVTPKTSSLVSDGLKTNIANLMQDRICQGHTRETPKDVTLQPG